MRTLRLLAAAIVVLLLVALPAPLLAQTPDTALKVSWRRPTTEAFRAGFSFFSLQHWDCNATDRFVWEYASKDTTATILLTKAAPGDSTCLFTRSYWLSVAARRTQISVSKPFWVVTPRAIVIPPPDTTTPPDTTGDPSSNEPAGMREILRLNVANGSKLATAQFGNIDYGTAPSRWTDDVYAIATYGRKAVEVVNDGWHGAGWPYAVESRYFVGDPQGMRNKFQNQTFGNTTFRELYVRFRWKLSPNYEAHAAGAKFMYFGIGLRGDQFYLMQRNAGSGFSVRFIPQITDAAMRGADGSGGAHPTVPNSTFARDTWITVELWLRAQSAPGASDGELKVWINGTRQQHETGAQWVSAAAPAESQKWKGVSMPHFWGGGAQTKTVADWVRIGEWYVSGRM